MSILKPSAVAKAERPVDSQIILALSEADFTSVASASAAAAGASSSTSITVASTSG